MVSDRLRTRLEQREAVLRLLDRRRAETGDPNLGRSMETKILDLELADLADAVALEESAERDLVPNVQPKASDQANEP
jgi:hypothetical protein